MNLQNKQWCFKQVGTGSILNQDLSTIPNKWLRQIWVWLRFRKS